MQLNWTCKTHWMTKQNQCGFNVLYWFLAIVVDVFCCFKMMTGIDLSVPGHPALHYCSIACPWESKSIQTWKQDYSNCYTKLHKQHVKEINQEKCTHPKKDVQFAMLLCAMCVEIPTTIRQMILSKLLMSSMILFM